MMLFALVVAALSMPTPDDDYYRYGSVYGGRVSYVPVREYINIKIVPHMLLYHRI